MSEQIPFLNKEKIISYFDIAKGLGEVILHAVTDQFRHEGVSEHFITDAADTEVRHGIQSQPESPTNTAA